MTIHFTIAFWIVLVLTLLIRLLRFSFDLQKTFSHRSPMVFLVFLLGCPIAFAAVVLVIAQAFRLNSIRVTDDTIEGRNYWGLKRVIPFTSINRFSRFGQFGINALVVHSESNGDIYILEHTEDLEELLDILGNKTTAEFDP